MLYDIIDDEGNRFEVKLNLVNLVPITKKNKKTDFNTKIIKIESLSNQLYLEYIPKSNAGSSVRFGSLCENSNSKIKSSAFSIYTTGSISSPGRRSIPSIKINFFQFTNLLKYVKQPFFKYDPRTLKLIKGYPTKVPLIRFVKKETQISNIVLTCHFPPKYIHLNEIHRLYRKNSKYYPEKYPGLDMKFLPGEVFGFGFTFSIYATGSINLLGFINEYQINLAFNKLVSIISNSYAISKFTKIDYAWKYSHNHFQSNDNKTNSYYNFNQSISKRTNPNINKCETEKYKKISAKGIKKISLTSKERNLKFKNPERFFFKKKGFVKYKNSQKNIFDCGDFKKEIQKKYLSIDKNEKKIFNN